MWQALLPPGFRYADEVDLVHVAERHLFSGGLIKNCLLLVATAAGSTASKIITAAALEQAAYQQSGTFSDQDGICTVYEPRVTMADVALPEEQQNQLLNAATAWQRLKAQGMGLTTLINVTDLSTGIRAAQALAAACGLKVREFDFDRIMSFKDEDRTLDPVTQKKVSPLKYAFANSGRDASLLLFVDYTGNIDHLLTEKPDYKSYFLGELTGYLRSYQGLFCLVTTLKKPARLPVEFSLRFDLKYPAIEQQLSRWLQHLGHCQAAEAAALVKHYPMHVAEIDLIAKQATIQEIIKGGAGTLTLDTIHAVISRYREKQGTQLLFGGK